MGELPKTVDLSMAYFGFYELVRLGVIYLLVMENGAQFINAFVDGERNIFGKNCLRYFEILVDEPDFEWLMML